MATLPMVARHDDYGPRQIKFSTKGFPVPFLIVSRYLSRLFLRCFLLFSGVLTGIILLFDFTELQRRAASRAPIPLFQKVEMVLLKMPFLLEQLLPFLIFGGALALFWRLNRHAELVVLKTSGFSAWQICLSPLIVALLIGLFDLTLGQPLSIELLKNYQQKDALYFDQQSQQTLSVSSSGLWVKKNEAQLSVIYHIKNLKAAEQTLENVSIYVFSTNQKFLARFDAATAHLLPQHIVLKKVWILDPDVPAQFKEAFTLPFHLTLSHIYNSSPDPELISVWRLPDLIALLDQAGLSSHKYVMQKASLWARALWLGALVLLAAAFSFRPLRKGGTFMLLVSGGVCCFLLYIVKDITYALGAAEKLPLLLSAWAPVILTFLVAIALLFHFEEGKV